MRAILVSVDYNDLLEITLPFNRHHFEEVMVVTSNNDLDAKRIAWANNAYVYQTDAFYDDGADFNKWKALEKALDAFGRYGWMCIMDADILWPKQVPDLDKYGLVPGCLYSPRRRIVPYIQGDTLDIEHIERNWDQFPMFGDNEFAGYTQMFNALDTHLPSPPWHEQDWRHTGGADSAFQDLWPPSYKLRPNWNVLHIGRPGLNWCGRSKEAQRKTLQYWYTRRANRNYSAERLPPQQSE